MSKPLFITDHARNAMMQRRISIDDVILTISDYETMDRNRNGTARYFRGDLCIVVVEESKRRVIKTVLYRFGNQWTDEEVRRRN